MSPDNSNLLAVLTQTQPRRSGPERLCYLILESYCGLAVRQNVEPKGSWRNWQYMASLATRGLPVAYEKASQDRVAGRSRT